MRCGLYLQLYSQDRWPSGQAIDVLVAEPKISPDAAEAIPVLLPVSVEGGQTDFPPLYEGPSTTLGLHVAVDLIMREDGDIIDWAGRHHEQAAVWRMIKVQCYAALLTGISLVVRVLK